jgi:NAD(P)-dependent dehydrogenase (short-subunit alcohol dehydrogenase family)
MNLMETFSVFGRSAIVTGAASGIGLAYAEVMAEQGAAVTMLDIDEVSLEREVARMKSAGHNVRGTKLDVTDRSALDAIFDDVAARHGSLDVVFANAGIDPGPGFGTLSPDGERVEAHRIEASEDGTWLRAIDVNLNAVYYSIRAAARHMRPSGAGSIIVTTSVSGIRPAPALNASYAAAKAGAAQLVRAAAIELAHSNVRVNAIAPGPFITNIGNGHVHDPEVQKRFSAGVPLGRMASTDEIRPLALYLASDASSFITGQQIAIDGGTSLLSARF